MKTARKSLTLLLTVALILTMMPLGAADAFAAGGSSAAVAGGDAR